MALQVKINLAGEAILSSEGIVTKTDASMSDIFYCRVENIVGDKRQISFDVSFSGKSGLASGKRTYQFEPSMTGANFIAQAYGYLKTLPEFLLSEDV